MGFKWLLAMVILVPVVNAQIATPKQALIRLQKAHPEITWDEKSPVRADVDCDGKPEVVVLGTNKDQVVVAITSKNPERQQLLKFPLRPDTEDGFCAAPTRVKLYRLDCETDEGPLPGCKPTRRCQAFTVDDDDCDAFNFYWDASQKKIAWWRH